MNIYKIFLLWLHHTRARVDSLRNKMKKWRCFFFFSSLYIYAFFELGSRVRSACRLVVVVVVVDRLGVICTIVNFIRIHTIKKKSFSIHTHTHNLNCVQSLDKFKRESAGFFLQHIKSLSPAQNCTQRRRSIDIQFIMHKIAIVYSPCTHRTKRGCRKGGFFSI